MLSVEKIQSLKRVNISKNADLTKERVGKIWHEAPRELKTDILALSGVSQASIYRIPREGAISARIALSMAQIVNIDPQYLTGEIDEKGEYTTQNAKSFLLAHGYERLTNKRTYKKREKKAEPVILNEETTIKQNAENESEKTNIVVDPVDQEIQQTEQLNDSEIPDFTDDEWLTIFKSMMLRSRSDVKVRKKLKNIKSLLLT